MASTIKPANEGESFFKPPREHKKRFLNGFPVGKRTEKREAVNRKLNKKFKIRECEIQIPGVCVRHIMLTWCHTKKSRFIVTDKDWEEAARGCLPCHDHIEALPHSEMAQIVRAAIAKRKPQTEEASFTH